ncbi:MAG: ISL3 family transposase [Methylocella sp.]
MATKQLFEAALGIKTPWYIQGVDFDADKHLLTIAVDFTAGSRFAHPDAPGEHPVHDTRTKRLRHLNFFQHECYLEVRVPRVRLPDGSVRQVEPDWVGHLDGFTLLFEALVVLLCQQMPFAAVAQMVGLSWHRVHAVCKRYVDEAVEETDLAELRAVSIDETSCRRGHDYVTLVADEAERRVVFVTEGKDAAAVAAFGEHLSSHGGKPEQIESACIDMSPAFIRGVNEHLPQARITYDKFHVVAHASTAVDVTRRREQKSDPQLKGLRWVLLKDRSKLNGEQCADLDALVAQYTTNRVARAWLYREQLRDILDRKQVNVVSAMLRQWCTNVMRSKVEAMKEVAGLVRRHFEGIVAWTQSRQTNAFIEALNGLFQAAKRKARGYTRFATMRTVLFLIAGKLDFSSLNPHLTVGRRALATNAP